MGDGKHVKLELLHKSSGEYQMVEKDIMRTAGGSIRGVTKVSLVCLRRCTCMYACACDVRACVQNDDVFLHNNYIFIQFWSLGKSS